MLNRDSENTKIFTKIIFLFSSVYIIHFKWNKNNYSGNWLIDHFIIATVFCYNKNQMYCGNWWMFFMRVDLLMINLVNLPFNFYLSWQMDIVEWPRKKLISILDVTMVLILDDSFHKQSSMFSYIQLKWYFNLFPDIHNR